MSGSFPAGPPRNADQGGKEGDLNIGARKTKEKVIIGRKAGAGVASRLQPGVGRLCIDTCQLASASFLYFFKAG
jgi:hypothetical protein